jgi:hypothetical protein
LKQASPAAGSKRLVRTQYVAPLLLLLLEGVIVTCTLLLVPASMRADKPKLGLSSTTSSSLCSLVEVCVAVPPPQADKPIRTRPVAAQKTRNSLDRFMVTHHSSNK